MVGTVEPRKGYLQTIDAFSRLWADGIDVNLVIVGTEGWKGLPDEMRRDIPEPLNACGATLNAKDACSGSKGSATNTSRRSTLPQPA